MPKARPRKTALEKSLSRCRSIVEQSDPAPDGDALFVDCFELLNLMVFQDHCFDCLDSTKGVVDDLVHGGVVGDDLLGQLLHLGCKAVAWKKGHGEIEQQDQRDTPVQAEQIQKDHDAAEAVANSCGTSIIQKVMYFIDSCRQWAASSEEFFPSK